jgi:membrane protein
MFIEMIKSEFKQLQGPFKLALLLIAIMTGSIFLIVHFIFLILGVESTGAIILWHLVYGIVNMFLQFLYPFLTFGLYVFGGYIFYRNMYSTNTVSANKLILSKFIPMLIFQIVVRVALLLSTERILGGLDALRYGYGYGYGYGISFGDIVSYSEFAFFDIYDSCTTTGILGFEIFMAKLVGIFAATLLLWLCVSIEKLFKKTCGVFGIILFLGICLLLFAEQFTEPLIMRVIRSYPKELLDIRLTEIHCHVRTMASIIKNVVLVIIYYILSYIIVKIGLEKEIKNRVIYRRN